MLKCQTGNMPYVASREKFKGIPIWTPYIRFETEISVRPFNSFKKLEFFEQVGKIHYFRAGSIKRAGRNFEQNSINEQVLIRASRLENDQNFLVRACSLNRHTRVIGKRGKSGQPVKTESRVRNVL